MRGRAKPAAAWSAFVRVWRLIRWTTAFCSKITTSGGLSRVTGWFPLPSTARLRVRALPVISERVMTTCSRDLNWIS